MSIALIVLLPLLGAILPALMIRSGRNACMISAAIVNGLALILLLTLTPAVFSGESPPVVHWPWMPQIGLEITFWLDGLGWLFALMILGIGLLIILYARSYLSRTDPMGNFYCYLLLFQAAMVGIVLSDNLLLMMVFWELTSLSSFLLIGFWGHLPAGRQGARMALAVTGAGGLALTAGVLLLGNVAGTYRISEVLQQRDVIQQSEWFTTILGLILAGCFTKSAQFPFHFWLPRAMAAPTPVSAYLHSATMVKAGLFLMARLWPVLHNDQEWFYIVATTGLVTMLIGAIIALFQDDLKGLLAYSTISHLGLITMLLGFATPMAVVVAIFHVMNHATFKAALFMNAGIVDHEAGTRDIQKLGGLFGLMPITAIMALLAAFSMAGIPPLNGFLSKEMMLEEVAHTGWMGNETIMSMIVTVAATFSVAYSFRYVFSVFFGRQREHYPHHPHDPPFGLWGPPSVLVVLVVLIGIWPGAVAETIVKVVSKSTLQGATPDFHLKLWHGWTPAAQMSAIAVAVGAVLLAVYALPRGLWNIVPRPDAKRIFDGVVGTLTQSSRLLIDGIHNGSQQRYLLLTLVAIMGFTGWAFTSFPWAHGTRPTLDINVTLVVGWILVVGATFLVVTNYRNRLFALIALGVVGLFSSLGFVYISAVDLALTQISVEVVTLILMLLTLFFLPKNSQPESASWVRFRDALVGVVAGIGMGGMSWLMMTREWSLPSIKDYFLAQSKPGGGGANVVNVILVDFRGFDTFGEITVLGCAGLAIFAMLDGLLQGKLRAKVLNWEPGIVRSADRHPLMMVVVTRVMLPLAVMVGAFIFMRGHNLPGGGFIAALIVSIALIMQYMASGFGWAANQVRFKYHALIGSGVLIAAATGIGAMVFDLPFLTSWHDHWHPPVIPLGTYGGQAYGWDFGEFEFASAVAFDLGVFLTVVGAVMLALAQYSKLGSTAAEFQINRKPMDFDPSLPDQNKSL
jgi:multicomponent K+:H+ antiporter subunit A